MKVIITIVISLLAGCTSFSPTSNLTLIEEASVEEVIKARRHQCKNQAWLLGIENSVEWEAAGKDAEAQCLIKNIKAFEHKLQDGFKIYSFEDLNQYGNGEIGFALVIDGKVVEKFVTYLQFIAG